MNVENFINLDKVVEYLQADGTSECQWLPQQMVREAFLKWLQSVLEAIDQDPQWFVVNLNTKHFYKHLPEPEYDPKFDSESPEFEADRAA